MGALFFALAAFGMQVDVPRAELCMAAHRVVLAEVTSQEVLWSPGSEGGLETRTWFTTKRDIRAPGPENIELVMPGGQKDGFEHWVEHSPTFVEGQQYLLFLAPHPERGLEVLGGEQGAIAIRQTPGGPGETLSSALRSLGGCYAP